MADTVAEDEDCGMKTRTLQIAAAVGAALVLLVVVALALGDGGVRSYPSGSPEAGLQTFLQALLDDDVDEARESLTPAAEARCEDHELRWNPLTWQDSAQITDVDVEGGVATLTVVTASRSGPFGDPFESEYEFTMEQIAGEWLIADLDERFGCR